MKDLIALADPKQLNIPYTRLAAIMIEWGVSEMKADLTT